MTIALWIIAVCSVVRIVQNSIQLRSLRRNSRSYDGALQEFVKSLNRTDKEFVREVLKEFEKEQEAEE